MRIGEQRNNETTKLFAPLGIVGAMGGSIYNRGFKYDIQEICPHPPQPERIFKWSSPLIKGSDGSYVLIDDERFLVRAVPITHSIFCLGFVIEERLPKLGKLDAEKIEREYKLPPGPLYKDLAQGRSVITPDGVRIDPKDVYLPGRLPRKIVILGDTCNPSAIAPLAMDADVLVHEATCLNEEMDVALRQMHSTAGMAGEFAKRIRAKELILNHFSPRAVGSTNE